CKQIFFASNTRAKSSGNFSFIIEFTFFGGEYDDTITRSSSPNSSGCSIFEYIHTGNIFWVNVHGIALIRYLVENNQRVRISMYSGSSSYLILWNIVGGIKIKMLNHSRNLNSDILQYIWIAVLADFFGC